MPPVWIVIALIVVLGVPFMLWWWKDADKRADAEHRRFKPKLPPKQSRVVVRGLSGDAKERSPRGVRAE